MTKALDIIAETFVEGRTEPVGRLHAAAIVRMLNENGFRVVEPGELDRETVEKIAEWLEPQRSDVPAHGWEFAAALRESKGGQL